MREGALDAARIERELDDTRSRLDATLSSLQDKLAPASLADQAVTYFKEVGEVELGRSISRSMRDNRSRLRLIGVGLGWLVFSGARRSEGSSANGWRDHSGRARAASAADVIAACMVAIARVCRIPTAMLLTPTSPCRTKRLPTTTWLPRRDAPACRSSVRLARPKRHSKPVFRTLGVPCLVWHGMSARRRRAFASASSGRWSRRPEVFVRSSPMRASVPSIWPTAPRQPLVTPTIMAVPPPPTCNAGPG